MLEKPPRWCCYRVPSEWRTCAVVPMYRRKSLLWCWANTEWLPCRPSYCHQQSSYAPTEWHTFRTGWCPPPSGWHDSAETPTSTGATLYRPNRRHDIQLFMQHHDMKSEVSNSAEQRLTPKLVCNKLISIGLNVKHSYLMCSPMWHSISILNNRKIIGKKLKRWLQWQFVPPTCRFYSLYSRLFV